VERKSAAAAAVVAAARAKALEDEKVKAYLEKKAAMDAAKASASQTLARIFMISSLFTYLPLLHP
jgi:hypothetical protein